MLFNEKDPLDDRNLPHTPIKLWDCDRAHYKSRCQYFTSLKRIISVIYDIVYTYSALLHKIPPLADVNLLALTSKIYMASLEKDFEDLITEKNMAKWEEEPYENDAKKMSLLLLEATIEGLTLVVKTLNSVDILCENFNNLKGLVIPEALEKTESVLHSVTRVRSMVKHTGGVLKIPGGGYRSSTSSEGLNEEKMILRKGFLVLEASMIRYFLRVIGKNFINEEITVEDCTFIYRRRLVKVMERQSITIPFTNEKQQQEIKNLFMNSGIIIVIVLGLLLVFACFRLYDLLASK